MTGTAGYESSSRVREVEGMKLSRGYIRGWHVRLAEGRMGKTWDMEHCS